MAKSQPKPRRPRHTSFKGRKFIQNHEGLRLCPYKVGEFERYWTIGYGHYGPDVKPGVCITQKQASRLLKDDLGQFEEAVRDALQHSNNVHQEEFDALVPISYNLGPGVLLDPDYSTLARRLASKESRSYSGRCRIYRDEFPKWVKGGGQTLPGLVQRRKDEKRLACRGRYD